MKLEIKIQNYDWKKHWTKTCPIITSHKAIMVPLELLDEWKIKYQFHVQRPGHLIVTNVGALHSVINLTSSIAYSNQIYLDCVRKYPYPKFCNCDHRAEERVDLPLYGFFRDRGNMKELSELNTKLTNLVEENCSLKVRNSESEKQIEQLISAVNRLTFNTNRETNSELSSTSSNSRTDENEPMLIDEQLNDMKSEKKYRCKYCPKTFDRNSNLERHINIHLADRPKFTCDKCGEIYVDKRGLIRHIDRKHPN